MLGILAQIIMSRERRPVSSPVSLFIKNEIRSHWLEAYHMIRPKPISDKGNGDILLAYSSPLDLRMGQASPYLKGWPCESKGISEDGIGK